MYSIFDHDVNLIGFYDHVLDYEKHYWKPKKLKVVEVYMLYVGDYLRIQMVNYLQDDPMID
jgi:hypothetical protein